MQMFSACGPPAVLSGARAETNVDWFREHLRGLKPKL
jgi:hypothetical protein